jgi:hypothetical protein
MRIDYSAWCVMVFCKDWFYSSDPSKERPIFSSNCLNFFYTTPIHLSELTSWKYFFFSFSKKIFLLRGVLFWTHFYRQKYNTMWHVSLFFYTSILIYFLFFKNSPTQKLIHLKLYICHCLRFKYLYRHACCLKNKPLINL